MANRRCGVWVYRKTDKGWRYQRPLVGKNNKIRPEPGVTYYIRYREGSKTIWRKCSSAATAVAQCTQQEAYLNAKDQGLTPAQQFTPVAKMMSDLLPLYLEEYKLSHRPESHALMKQTLDEFHALTRKNLIEKISRVDLLGYRAWLIERKRSPRTAANKILRVNQFIRAVLKLREGEGPVTVKDAKFTELEPTVFNDDELKAFFAACDPFRYAVFQCYLRSGLRKQELENLEWTDVDYTAGTIAVSPKPDFDPKDWEQRTIEVDETLLGILKEMPKRSPTAAVTCTHILGMMR